MTSLFRARKELLMDLFVNFLAVVVIISFLHPKHYTAFLIARRVLTDSRHHTLLRSRKDLLMDLFVNFLAVVIISFLHPVEHPQY